MTLFILDSNQQTRGATNIFQAGAAYVSGIGVGGTTRYQLVVSAQFTLLLTVDFIDRITRIL